MTATVESPIENKKLSSADLQKMRAADRKMVKGIFRCFEPRGGSMTFSFKKYRQDPVESFTMVDGDTYTVPLMIAKHLNQNCAYPVHSHVLDANGHPTVQVGKRVKRCSFESLEFAGADLDS